MPGFCSVCLPQLLQRGIGEPPLIPCSWLSCSPSFGFPMGQSLGGARSCPRSFSFGLSLFLPFSPFAISPLCPISGRAGPLPGTLQTERKAQGAGKEDKARGMPAEARSQLMRGHSGPPHGPGEPRGSPPACRVAARGLGRAGDRGHPEAPRRSRVPPSAGRAPGGAVCHGTVLGTAARRSQLLFLAARGQLPAAAALLFLILPPRDKRGRGEGRGIPLLPPVWAARELLGSFPIFALLPS